ncbi:MAG: hypothetical protein R8K21_08080 [Mariprofundales bacterium]
MSTQVQHFLTAVASTGYGKSGIKLMIGHEKLSDRSSSFEQQFNETTNTDIQNWHKAVNADSVGNYSYRDKLLWEILNFDTATPIGNVEPARAGNSLQDLRLSLKGYRFYFWIQQHATSHTNNAANWLWLNLGPGLKYYR